MRPSPFLNMIPAEMLRRGVFKPFWNSQRLSVSARAHFPDIHPIQIAKNQIMKTKLLYSIAGLILCLSAVAAPPVSLPEYGFEIELLDGDPREAPAQALMTFLPPIDGFAPNVNVMIQPYPETIEDYISLSKGQFAEMKWTVVSENKVSDTEWIVEYSGVLDQSELRWISRAILSDGKIYLVTATAASSSWDAVSERLKQSVNSFRIETP